VLDLIRSFLTDRTQQVAYGGRLSPVSVLLYGVPQGSVLGPLLYLLYTAELNYAWTTVTHYCMASPMDYSDDCSQYEMLQHALSRAHAAWTH